MRVDVIGPDGGRQEVALKDGEKVEVAAGEDVMLRLRRVSRGHVTLELWPAEEPRERRERMRLVT